MAKPTHAPRLTHVQVIALGFAIMILAGTLLLMLPAASADGQSAPFREALFTAVSSSCVTGLVLRDTATAWSFFGQVIIIVLIQIGGLGFMTVATFAFLLAQKRMGLRSREIMLESINNSNMNGIVQFSGEIIAGTAIFEGTGALLLATVFVPRMGWKKGLWYSVFHAISAFCNAGFDLMGFQEPFSSFVSMADNVVVNVTFMLLIILGGLGFLVWHDIRVNGFHFKRYSLHTKLVLTVSAVLVFGSALLILIFERNATGAGLPFGQQVMNALFASVTARTAGFNTIDIPSMSNGSKLVTILLMVVGGSPGSTAGGVKTTSIAVIVLYMVGGFRGSRKPAVFGKSINPDLFRKSCIILFFNAGLALMATLILAGLQNFDLVDIMFETFSAVGTVGMTAGITRDLLPVSSYIIALLMFMGRVGSVSFAVALLEKKAKPPVTYPEETVTVG
ncbi:MAG: Trk family potassium uptake protein [Lachnospiraceae bacterium]|nr:Trk family potassium uptake protein [Lachnospiraceae bacterium]